MAICPQHPDSEGAATCASCGVPMCAACWRRSVDGAPWCEGCVELAQRPASGGHYVAFAAVGVLLIGLAARALPVPASLGELAGMAPGLWARGLVIVVVGAAIAIATGVLYRRRRARVIDRVVSERPEAPPGPARGLYRGGPTRAARRLAPPISGRATTVVIAAALGLAAGVVPTALALPRWIESELVLAMWWAISFATFVVLLYRGRRLARDVPPRADAEPEPQKKKKSNKRGLDLGGLDVPADGEGCAVGLAILALIGVTLLLAWALWELVIPALVVLIYAVVLHGIARVTNDRHGCEGDALRSVAWAALWATVYVVPLALLVALLHVVVAAAR